MMLKLGCYVRGDEPRTSFVVNINEDETVADLRKVIKEEKRPRFDDIPADSLFLWKVSVPNDQDFKKCVEALNLVDNNLLHPSEILSDIFSSGLERNTVHIIVERPHSGRRSALPSASLPGPHEKPANEKAWKTTFRGTGATLFRRGLDDMNKRRYDMLCANFVPVIQSSGMGKSRLMDEIAKLIFTIPFCFRTESNGGYPEADEAPREFFRLRSGETYNTVFDRLLLFFEKLFVAVRSELLEKFPTQVDTSLPVLWYNHLLQNRQRIYEEVVTTTENSIEAKRTLHYPITPVNSDTVKEDQRPVYIAAKALIDTINSYTKANGSEENSRPVQLLIYIDESHEMTTSEQTIRSVGYNVYQVLCSSLNELRDLDLFFVFLSTSPMLSDYYSSRVYWSARSRDAFITHVQTPYTELPFDVWKESYLVSEDEYTMDDVCSVEFMVRFGRPLWWTRWEAGDTMVKDTLVEFAMMKLSAQKYGGYTWESFLAAISVRLMLDFEPGGTRANEIGNLMVANHLRVANVIPSHREYMFSSTPSEPIVVEAAAQVLREQSMIKFLCDNVRNGVIEKGRRGELAARLLLTLAHDAALEMMNVERRDYQGNIEHFFTTPVPLLTFLNALFAQPHMKNIMEAVPDNQPTGTTFKESFKDAYIMFTHFGKATDDWCISDEFAFMALTRNMAIACRERMNFVDLCIPIHFGKENRLSINTTGAIFITIKDQEKAMGYDIDVNKMEFFTDETNQRPVINLILQFGDQSAGRYMPIERTKPPGLLATPTGRRKGRDGQDVPQTPTGMPMLRGENSDKPKTRAEEDSTPGPACYTINAIGCSSNIYGVVKPEEEPLWHDLLASRDFLSGRGRQDTDHLDASLAQKPIWTSGPECCRWAKFKLDEELPSQDLLVEEEAGVSEGIFLGIL